jgi:tetratricopeptide (TPR) repeat protein
VAKPKPKPKPKQATPSKPAAILNARLQYALVFLFTFLLYANTVTHEYALDDRAVTFENKFVTNGVSGIPDILQTFYWQGFWDLNSGLYRPLSLIVYAIQWQIAPDNPTVYHLVNVLLLALTSMVLLVVLRKLLVKWKLPLLPLMATLLFAAHPTHTEVGANIKSLDEILSLLFGLLALNGLFDYHKSGNRRHILLAVLCFGLSLLSKEGALLFILVLPLSIHFFTGVDIKKNLKAMIPFVVTLAVWLLIHEAVIQGAEAPRGEYSYRDNSLVGAPDMLSQKATAILMLGNYLKLMVFPHPLSSDYSFNQIPNIGFDNPVAIVSLLAYIGLIILAVRFLKRKHILSFSIWWYLITIALTCNLFVLIGATFADRFLFVPSLGFTIALGYLILKVSGARTSPAWMILVPILALYSFKTFTRNRDWKNDTTLFEADVKNAPGSARLQYNYATAILKTFVEDEDDKVKKVEHARRAVEALKRSNEIDPKVYNTHLNLSMAYFNADDFKNAAASASTAIPLEPLNPAAYEMLGKSTYRLGNSRVAIANLEAAIEKGATAANWKPDDDTYNYLGGAYFAMGDFSKAAMSFEKSVSVNPSNAEVWRNIGVCYGNMGQWQSSLNALNKAVSLEPDNAVNYRLIADTYTRMGDVSKASEFMLKYRQKGGQ